MRNLNDLIPAGSHTYSKSDDCFPANAPKTLIQAKKAIVIDSEFNEYIDFGMGLRSVILGHGHENVNAYVHYAVDSGVNFLRPCDLERELAELLIEIIPSAEMVKFGKSGSDVTSAAVKLARAYTGKSKIMVAKENPFISQHDWYMSTKVTNGGIIKDENVIEYSYDTMTVYTNGKEVDLYDYILDYERKDVAAIILDPSTVNINKDKLKYLRSLCTKLGIVFVLDEIISGFRYGISGVQGIFGVTPDLSTFGKSMGNGYSVSALCGKREIMQLGDRKYGDVFLLSGTYNAETVGLSAAIATITTLRNTPSIYEHINFVGKALTQGINFLAKRHNLESFIKAKCFEIDGKIIGSSPMVTFSDLRIKTIFDQEMVSRGILMPYIAPSAAHTPEQVSNAIIAIEHAMEKVKLALNSNLPLEEFLIDSWCEKPVFRKADNA